MLNSSNIRINPVNNTSHDVIDIIKRNGLRVGFDNNKLRDTLKRACLGLNNVSYELLENEILKSLKKNLSTEELEKLMVFISSGMIELDPEYDKVASRLLKQRLYKEVFGKSFTDAELENLYRHSFIESIVKGVSADIFDKRLLMLDLDLLASKLKIENDDLLGFMGMHTLYERYVLRINGRRAETPQAFWMRVAMGIAINENDANHWALQFYEIISSLRYLPSTPTLFHSGFVVPQLSSCFLSTVKDDLSHIFKCIGDNAQLAKWAGGLGTDWTNIRGVGSLIKSIKATSQGVVPFLKIANDVVVAITKSGIRRGGSCAYLEVWHIDIEAFLDLRRNTGDERMRTHDMNTANWIPDLFMKRIMEDKNWTLFSPDETPELHDLYGKKFEEKYEHYEKLAAEGKLKQHKSMPAKQLWRKMLTRLFETGHPWITFKDPSNIRSPQDHVGVVHSSNLCTEVILNTSENETAVCNLGSVNLEKHFSNGAIDFELIKDTVTKAIRMLDNVIDLNYYPVVEAKNSNLRHRPIGLGLMGFQDLLFKLDVPFSAEKALEISDVVSEHILYHAISASSDIAQEKGTYSTYAGSKWDRGIFPLDTIELLENERGMKIETSRTQTLNWQSLKEKVQKQGMRNSNTISIAPTATISTIAGCYPCIEPIYKNIYVESNISGEFTIVNTYLVNDLKQRNLWNKDMLDKLKYFDGDLTMIEEIDSRLKEKYKTAFEISPTWLIKISAARGKWIDQSQSHNIFIKGISGKILDEVYKAAWLNGLKTTYYLRTLGATQIEKSTLDANKFGFTQKRQYNQVAQACSIDNLDCESCQ